MRILVIRTSAMGDVALTVPVLAGLRKTYPETDIVLLTREAFRPFFRAVPGLFFFHPDLRNRHRGIRGTIELFRDIRASGRIDYVIDLHDVIRSKLLRNLFRLTGVKTAVIDKGRGEKKRITKGLSKKQLPHSVERYCDVFARAGFPVTIPEGPWITPSDRGKSLAAAIIKKEEVLNIGVAPFAKHDLKMWPVENMVSLIEMITEKYKANIWLFGGIDEQKRLEALSERIPGAGIISGTCSLEEELAVIGRLDYMIAMDSANMHMAALSGTRVISIWGGTDRIMGFGAWAQPDEHFISIPFTELPCRPCTVYGKGKCRRGDFACMNWLTPELVFGKLQKIII